MAMSTFMRCLLVLLAAALFVTAADAAGTTKPSKSVQAGNKTATPSVSTGTESKKNILFLLPLSSKSHKHVFELLSRRLGARGQL